MAIPKGMTSVARQSGAARVLLDIAEELGLEPKVVRTTSVHGYLVPNAVAEKYEETLKGGKGKRKASATPKATAAKAAPKKVDEKSDSATAESAPSAGDDKSTSDEKTVSPKAAAEKE
ncbi:MAG: hypothetical protein ACTH7X_08875 [Brevibacterium aurantiacum]